MFYGGKDQRRKGRTEDYTGREKVGEMKEQLEVEENPLKRREQVPKESMEQPKGKRVRVQIGQRKWEL